MPYGKRVKIQRANGSSFFSDVLNISALMPFFTRPNECCQCPAFSFGPDLDRSIRHIFDPPDNAERLGQPLYVLTKKNTLNLAGYLQKNMFHTEEL